MDSAVYIAKIVGPFMIIVALGLMLNRDTYIKMMEDFFKNKALVYIGGIMALLMGMIIVSFNNVWAWNWNTVITVFGWLGIIKGIWLVVLPNVRGKITKIFSKHPHLITIDAVIMLLIGIFITVRGYGSL